MTDCLTKDQRHRCMSHIHSQGTKPELKVRQWLWHHGYRYRLNVKSVPGSPDIVLRTYRTAIFVNGCFWHGHHVHFSIDNVQCTNYNFPCCKIPETNRRFWVDKIRRNQQRDLRNYQVLRDNGWQVIVVWECQLKAKLVESTMRRVELLLNQNFLDIHRSTPLLYGTEVEQPAALAAEAPATISPSADK